MGFKIPNITFSHKMYLKLRVHWPLVGEDLFNSDWSAVYNSSNSVTQFHKVINSLIDRRIPSKFIRQKVDHIAWFNEDCVNAFRNKQNAYSF